MPKKVLLVEDEDSIALALGFLIEREGHEVERAADAPAARRCLSNGCPDLVLLDVMLPGGSGFELCQEIRLDPRLSEVKILMLTASGGDMARRKSLALGADDFVAKPFSNGEIQAQVRRLLAEHAA